MRLYLIRHAQSENNIVYDGTDSSPNRVIDPEITNAGHQQSKALGEYLATPGNEPRQHAFLHDYAPDFGITHLYCSLMTRAILTAEHIARACQLQCEALPLVFEHKGLYHVGQSGDLEGDKGPGKSYFDDRFPWLQLPPDMNEDGWGEGVVESNQAFYQRVERAYGDLLHRHKDTDDVVALVTHWGFLDQFINAVVGIDPKPENMQSDWRANWVFENTSFSRLDLDNGATNIVYLNRTDHLTPDLKRIPGLPKP